MSDDGLVRLADELLAARDAARVISPPSASGSTLDLDAGYRVGRVLHDRLVARGFRPVGRKIGFTNRAMWGPFRVTEPVWAHAYGQTVHTAEAGVARIAVDGMAAPRLEPEVVLKLRRPVPAVDLSPAELAGCVEWAAIGLEVVDSHYPGWQFTAAEAVADFGVHAALVIGRPWELKGVDPGAAAEALEGLRVALRRGDQTFAEGHGRNALGSPLLALGFLARVVAAQPWAPPLAAGEVITTGTLTPLPHLGRGERWRVDVTGAPLQGVELEVGE